MQLSAELQLCIYLSHPKAPSLFLNSIQELFEKSIDFCELRRLIDYHRIWNNVALNIQKMPSIHLPQDFIDWLTRHQRSCIKQTLIQLHIQQKLTALLDKNRVHHRFIKGTELGQRLYGDVAWRFSRDIDLLILFDDAELTEKIIAQLGYVPSSTSWSHKDPATLLSLNMQKDNSYIAPNKPVLEVHHRISSFKDSFSLEMSAHLIQNAEGITFLEYLYLCWHALLTNCHRIKWLVDLAVYRARLDDEIPNWRFIARPFIYRYGLTRQIDFIDFLLDSFFDMTPQKKSEFWMPLLLNYYVEQWMLARPKFRASMMPIILNLLMQKNIKSYLWRLSELLICPNPEDQIFINRYYSYFGKFLLILLPFRKIGRYLSRLVKIEHSAS